MDPNAELHLKKATAVLTCARGVWNRRVLVGGRQQRCAAVKCPQLLAGVHVERRKLSVCEAHQQGAIAAAYLLGMDGRRVESMTHGAGIQGKAGSCRMTRAWPRWLLVGTYPPSCRAQYNLQTLKNAHTCRDKLSAAAQRQH